VAAYEGTFHRSVVEREKKEEDDPFSLAMAKQLMSTIGTVTGILGSFKRSSPSNIDFAATFLDKDNEGFSPAWEISPFLAYSKLLPKRCLLLPPPPLRHTNRPPPPSL
jgi:hypothetical protein